MYHTAQVCTRLFIKCDVLALEKLNVADFENVLPSIFLLLLTQPKDVLDVLDHRISIIKGVVGPESADYFKAVGFGYLISVDQLSELPRLDPSSIVDSVCANIKTGPETRNAFIQKVLHGIVLLLFDVRIKYDRSLLKSDTLALVVLCLVLERKIIFFQKWAGILKGKDLVQLDLIVNSSADRSRIEIAFFVQIILRHCCSEIDKVAD